MTQIETEAERRKETSILKILRVKKREYRDGKTVKRQDRDGGRHTMSYLGITEGFKPICAHRLQHTSPILPHICCICRFYIVMEL